MGDRSKLIYYRVEFIGGKWCVGVYHGGVWQKTKKFRSTSMMMRFLDAYQFEGEEQADDAALSEEINKPIGISHKDFDAHGRY